ncbi:Transcriptional regulator CRZ1 [Pleurostoma richardsiae]|uniref:Transcriptional regulator CRZ1 n=1 Tax=Pleurostoma richardsiae TaxID=41990 RepID=A0AA38R338_9PEZI|nr:Transcriptional regulator CRZ1 [Pleurostoma richardsiae]
MDQQQGRGRSPSATGHQQPHISHSHSPSPARPFPTSEASGIGLGVSLDASSSQQFPGASPDFSAFNPNNGAGFLNPQQPFGDPSFSLGQDFTSQLEADDPSTSPFAQPQPQFSQNTLTPGFNDDFTIFPATTGEQFSTPLFAGDPSLTQQLGVADGTMASAQPHHSPTPPHLLKPEPQSAHQSPSFNQHQFSSSPAGRHSRTVSLGPEAALLPGQTDWSTAPQFQGHRRTPSEYSDVSSATHSPNLVANDSFEQIDHNQSPMQHAQDAGLYHELHGIGSFSISDNSPGRNGRSPSHSPAISPRLVPQQMPDMSQQNSYTLASNGFVGGAAYGMQAQEAFPQLPQTGVVGDMTQQQQAPQMVPPAINIDYAPTAVRNGFDSRPSMDTDALTPPERGRPRSRPRAVTDPYNTGSTTLNRQPPSASLSPHLGAELSPARSDSSRSLSPLDRQAASPNRRRQSTSAVPNNVIALRLVEPELGGIQQADGSQGPKRVQKHPATFQCTLCPKRFTRAYNLRSHLRTHTDERPFVCTVCGKAFARQHDRKRHEGLHSGEKKFVCKGDLKAGGQWGCGRRFARADALGRHFRSEAGRICIKPLLDEELLERQRIWGEQHLAQQQAAAAQQMAMGGMMAPPGMDAAGYPMDAAGNYMLPQALLTQYPALATMNWGQTGMGDGGGSGMEDELSGRSSFDASDYGDDDEGGYVSGPGTGFGQGGMNEGFGEMGYASDYGGR